MPERASVFQGVQLGLETVPGTPIAATTKLLSTSFDVNVMQTINEFRAKGTKFNTTAALGKEWGEGSITGEGNYNELTYLLASLINLPAVPTPVTGASTWVFSPNSSGEDTVATYSIEQGDTNRAERMPYSVIKDLTIKGNRDKIEVSGATMGQRLDTTAAMTRAAQSDVQTITYTATQGTFTITFTPTGGAGQTTTALACNASTATVQAAIQALAGVGAGNALVTGTPGAYVITFTSTLANKVENLLTTATIAPFDGTIVVGHTTFGATTISSPIQQMILPSEVSLYLDNSSAALGTTKFLRMLEWEWNLTGRFNPLWTVDASQLSWAAKVEGVPKLSGKIMVEADNQAMSNSGFDLIQRGRDTATKFMRIEALGTIIGGALRYRLAIDMAIKMKSPQKFADKDGVFAIDFELMGVHDQGWGKAVNITLVNTQATIYPY